jgi:hypothetical protein
MREHQRIRTEDLTATVHRGCPRLAGEVRNLSARGMLVEGVDVPVGRRLHFELRGGPGWAFTGQARVAHVTEGATGLCVERWHGEEARAVRTHVEREAGHAPA